MPQSAELTLQQSRASLERAFGILNRIMSKSPETRERLLPQWNVLGRKQAALETELAQAQAQGNCGSDLGLPILIPIIGAATLGTGFLGFKISQQLTESTDYEARLECVDEALGQNLNQEEALRVCGMSRSSSVLPLLIVGSLVLGGIFLLKKR